MDAQAVLNCRMVELTPAAALDSAIDKENTEASFWARQRMVQMQITVQNEHAKQQAADRMQQQLLKNGTQRYLCTIQSTEHKVFECPEFVSLMLENRRHAAKQGKLCYNCLKRGHFKDQCWDQHRCHEQLCVQRNDTMHNSMLCLARNRTEYAAMMRTARSKSPASYRFAGKRGRGHYRPNKRPGDGSDNWLASHKRSKISHHLIESTEYKQESAEKKPDSTEK